MQRAISKYLFTIMTKKGWHESAWFQRGDPIVKIFREEDFGPITRGVSNGTSTVEVLSVLPEKV